jgi:dipeptidyl aminopeptidase/acylaminoacyl peptidase
MTDRGLGVVMARPVLGTATKRTVVSLAAAVSVVLGAGAAPLEASAQTAGTNGRIVFVKLGDIWVMDAAGGNQTNLTNTPEIDESGPDWSPDGTRIAFTLRVDPGAGGFGDIYVMDADPSTDDAANLTDTAGFNEYHPSWAPSGIRLAFVREVPGAIISDQPDIFVMDANGANATNITQTDANELYPAWSPDGAKIAFSGVRDGGSEILTMDPDGQNEAILTGDGTDAFDEAPEWSPDSTKVVFMKQSQAAGCCDPWEVWAVNRDGSGDTNLTNHPSDDMGPSWSPDGSEIIFSSTRDAAPGESDIYAMPAPTLLPPAGGLGLAAIAAATVRRLTTDRASTAPDWGRQDTGPANTAPTVTNLRPPRDSTVTDRTPMIGATVSDAETNLAKSAITLFLDGTRVARTAFAYSRDTDRLRYTPSTPLFLGRHTVTVVARDPVGLVKRTVWSFRIARP